MCTPNCVYFPDVTLKNGEWHLDEELNVKVMNEHKELKCLYDNHVIEWCEKCPKNKANLHLENLKNQIKKIYEADYE